MICKLNLLSHLTGHSGFAMKDVIAVGDGENDICLLSAVPLSFAFRPKSESVRAAALYAIDDSLSDLLGAVYRAEMSDRDRETDLLVTAQ
jgi:phosphoserine phosphatase